MFADHDENARNTIRKRKVGEFIFEVMKDCVYCRASFALCKSNLFLQDHVLHIAELPVSVPFADHLGETDSIHFREV